MEPKKIQRYIKQINCCCDYLVCCLGLANSLGPRGSLLHWRSKTFFQTYVGPFLRIAIMSRTYSMVGLELLLSQLEHLQPQGTLLMVTGKAVIGQLWCLHTSIPTYNTSVSGHRGYSTLQIIWLNKTLCSQYSFIILLTTLLGSQFIVASA